MTHNLDATVYVYRHRETGTIKALYSDDACAMHYRPDYEHVATLEPRMWIEHHFDDAVKERKACAKVCRDRYDETDVGHEALEDCEALILARGNQ